MDYDPFYSLPFVQDRALSYVPPGQYAGGGGPSGTPGFFDIAGSNVYRAPYNPPAWSPSLAPLANTPLNNPQTLPGFIASAVGNYAVSQHLRNYGLTPRGNTGSYMQALRLREQQERIMRVNEGLRDLESDNLFKQFKGFAAVTGFMGPMDQAQADALRASADTWASYMPGMQAMPQSQLLATLLSGQRGSIYAMSAPMMDANRFRRDITTGQQGYSAENSQQMIRDVYKAMFESDPRTRSLGMRTEEFGAAYRALSAESLVAPRGDLRTRTIEAAKAVMAETGVDLPQLLSAGGGIPTGETDIGRLPDTQLQSLRQSPAVQQQLRKTDTRQIIDQVGNFTESLAAIKEVFTESGQDASIPKLLNALKALTNNRVNSFSTAELRSLTREMQAISQTTGKNIEEVFALHQASIAAAEQMLGDVGPKVAPSITRMQAAAGANYRERGGMTGEFARDQQYIEALAGSFYTRTIDSQTTNIYGLMQRLEERGVKTKDTVEGRRTQAAIDAAKRGQSKYTYTDAQGRQQEAITPTRNDEFVAIAANAFEGMTPELLSLELADTKANRRAATHSQAVLDAASNLASAQIRREKLVPQLVNMLQFSELGQSITDPEEQKRVLRGAAEVTAEAALDMSQVSDALLQDTEKLAQFFADRVTQRFQDEGKPLNAAQQKMLKGSLGGAKATMDLVFNMEKLDSTDVFRYIDPTTTRKQANISLARSRINEAMSPLSKFKGSTALQSIASAIEKAGSLGSEASFSQLVLDIFGDDVELRDEMTQIHSERAALSKMEAQLSDIESPEERAKLMEKLDRESAALKKRVELAAENAQKSTTIRALTDATAMVDNGQLTRSGMSNARLSTTDMLTAAIGVTRPSEEDLRERAAKITGFGSGDELDKDIAKLPDQKAQAARRADLAAQASRQVTVQGQLSASGELKNPDAKIYDRESLLANLPENSQLRDMLLRDGDKSWEDVSQEYLTLKTLQMFGRTPAEIEAEQNRRGADAAAAQSTTPGMLIKHQFTNANKFFDAAATILDSKADLSPEAQTAKLRLAEGRAAAGRMTEMAGKYFGGSVSQMILSQGMGITADGRARLKEEFAKLTPGQREDLSKDLAFTGLDVSADKLTAAHYGHKLVSDMFNDVGVMDKSVAAASGTLAKIPDLVSNKPGIFDIFEPLIPLWQQLTTSDPAAVMKKWLGTPDVTAPATAPGATSTAVPGSTSSWGPPRRLDILTPESTTQVASNTASSKEMRLTGTVEVRGDIIGMMTLGNVIAEKA